MKILHICLGNYFIDGYSYQDNMLPKFHKHMGYDVDVIAPLFAYDENGKGVISGKATEYINEFGVKVTRLEYKEPIKVYKKFKRFVGLPEALDNSKPDIMFIHNCQFLDMDIVVKYLKKHPQVKVYVDNHADPSNSATNWFSKNILHKKIWRRCAQMIEPFTTKFYGVLPVRVEFLKEMYKLPAEKCELLVMGADDDMVKAAADPAVKAEIRAKYNIAEDDFLVITGGKIDAFKTQTLMLMEAVRGIDNPKLKLIVFGSVTSELKDKVAALADGEKVQYIGWVKSEESYAYFAAADLAVFPGRHSVFWEQVAAQGIPMLCKEWNGTTHVDLGGNVRFLTEDSAEEIKREIERLISEPEAYDNMKKIALDKGMQNFSYENISKRSIELV